MPRYSNEEILAASKDADSIYAVMRRLGMRLTGGSHGHLKSRMIALGIDIGAMARIGRASNKGKTFPHLRRTAKSILVLRDSGKRQYSKYLRRALTETGRPYICEGCGNTGEWLGKKLTLEVDHKSRNWLDDRAKNLRFVCPNCHTVI